MSVEKLSKTRREAIVMAGLWLAHDRQSSLQQPQTRKMPFASNLPRWNPALPVPHWTFPWRIKPFCSSCESNSLTMSNSLSTGFLMPCCPQITDGENPESTPKHPTISPTAHLYRLNHRTNHKNHVKPYKNPQYYHFVQCWYCNFTNEA